MREESLFTNNELIELSNILKSRDMLHVDSIGLYPVPAEGGTMTLLYFHKGARSQKITLYSKKRVFGLKAFHQLEIIFKKRERRVV